MKALPFFEWNVFYQSWRVNSQIIRMKLIGNTAVLKESTVVGYSH